MVSDELSKWNLQNMILYCVIWYLYIYVKCNDLNYSCKPDETYVEY